MSQLGRKATAAGRFGMSGLPLIADIVRQHAEVRSGHHRKSAGHSISSLLALAGNHATGMIDPGGAQHMSSRSKE
jgi:hypothetical protein